MNAKLQVRLQAALGDHLRIERALTPGGMSLVFLAKDTILGRHVVLKVLPPELAGAVNVERFRREIQLLATLQHPLVVPIIGAGESDGLIWYSMPFVQGESLRGRLEATRPAGLPVAEAGAILRDVCRALAFAHERGVIHRDIKPDNVLLSKGAAALADFGIARAVSRAITTDQETLTGTGFSPGTPAYMAPEQIAADPGADHRMDLYALGIMAYEMLEGRLPFEGLSGVEQLAGKVAAGAPAMRRRDIPDELRTLVSACLAPRPADRPPSAQAIAEVLERSMTVSTSRRRTGPDQRSAWMAGAGLAAVIAAGVTLASIVKPADSGTRVIAAPASRQESQPLRPEVRPPLLSRDSTVLLVFAAAGDDPAARGRRADVDSAAAEVARRLSRLRVVRAEVVSGASGLSSVLGLRTELQARGARFGIVPWVRVMRGRTQAGARLLDLAAPGVDEGRGECEVEGDSFAGSARDSAVRDVASRIHGLFLLSFDRGPLPLAPIMNSATKQHILRCGDERGLPVEAITAFLAFQRARDRGDRPAALAALDSALARDSSSPLASLARRERYAFSSNSQVERGAAWERENPPPPLDASPLEVAEYRARRAAAVGDIRGQLESAREAYALGASAQQLWNSLIAAARPVEARSLIDAELKPLEASPDASPVRLGYLRHQRTLTGWLLEDDAGMLADASATIGTAGTNPVTLQRTVPYLLQAHLALGDTTAWRAAYERLAPEQPLARAQLLSNSMNFAVARGDTAVGRRLAEELASEFRPYLGQRDVSASLAVTVATAYRWAGQPSQALDLLLAAETNSDRVVAHAARLQLLSVAATVGDEATLIRQMEWIDEVLEREDPPAALLAMARLRAVQGNLPEAWRFLEAYSAHGLTRWQARARVDPDLSLIRAYPPARGFFTSR